MVETFNNRQFKNMVGETESEMQSGVTKMTQEIPIYSSRAIDFTEGVLDYITGSLPTA
ncbi:MAG: hypothetical protein V7725_04425 [Porticoccus sp.]